METHWNTTEVDTMPHRWPADTDFRFWELDVLDRDCASCGRMMHICDHRYRHFYTLEGPVELVCKLNHCPNPDCPGHAKTKSPEMEATIALPAWAIGWDVFCWIGHRRFARHWSIPQIRHELIDSYAIELTEPCIALYVQRYQTMLAVRQQDFEAMRRQYEGVDDIILTIDGLQPENGHETLYVVRELTQKRVWFAVPLLSATAPEVQRLIAQAKQWAEILGKRVILWVSDKQDAFVTGIAAEFPEVPHRYCDNHFLRDAAKPRATASKIPVILAVLDGNVVCSYNVYYWHIFNNHPNYGCKSLECSQNFRSITVSGLPYLMKNPHFDAVALPPSPFWMPTATPRFKCGRKCVA